MKGSMDRVQRGGPWTGSTGVVHGPGVHVLYTSPLDRFPINTLSRFTDFVFISYFLRSFTSS